VRHGLSPGEIAQVLDQSEGQIRELLNQARQAIFGHGQNAGEA
jgi:DNA-directed RNA polymerase specialized sigma24 family protein